MSLINGNANRSVIPRWRISGSFDKSPESSSIRKIKVADSSVETWFERTLAEWKEHRTVGLLADLFSTAVVEGNSTSLIDLAIEVIKLEDKVPVSLQKVASQIISSRTGPSIAPDAIDLGDANVVGGYIATLRAKSIESPNNGFVWNDLSYAYNLIGEKEKSERAMLVALRVSSSHRLIARGASRLYMHHKDPERALSVLKKAQGFSRDPWLVSAHIAVSQASGSESPSISVARRLLDVIGLGHRNSSELGMALATEEMWSGKIKRAKAIARESSIDATENALAQAVWMAPRLRSDVVAKSTIDSVEGAFEARSWGAYYNGDWKSSVDNVIGWLRDEPYSVVPALQGSFVAATFMNDYLMSLKIAEFGLKHNPDSWGLRNNFVVALAMIGDGQRSDEEFSRLPEPAAGSSDYAVWLATKGLLSYRHNSVDLGRELYMSARDAFEKSKDRTSQLTLALYQSIEEARAGNDQQARELIDEVHRKLGFKGEHTSIIDALVSEVQSEGERRSIGVRGVISDRT